MTLSSLVTSPGRQLVTGGEMREGVAVPSSAADSSSRGGGTSLAYSVISVALGEIALLGAASLVKSNPIAAVVIGATGVAYLRIGYEWGFDAGMRLMRSLYQ